MFKGLLKAIKQKFSSNLSFEKNWLCNWQIFVHLQLSYLTINSLQNSFIIHRLSSIMNVVWILTDVPPFCILTPFGLMSIFASGETFFYFQFSWHAFWITLINLELMKKKINQGLTRLATFWLLLESVLIYRQSTIFFIAH